MSVKHDTTLTVLARLLPITLSDNGGSSRIIDCIYLTRLEIHGGIRRLPQSSNRHFDLSADGRLVLHCNTSKPMPRFRLHFFYCFICSIPFS